MISATWDVSYLWSQFNACRFGRNLTDFDRKLALVERNSA